MADNPTPPRSSTTGGNLDISQIEDADLETLAGEIEKFYRDDNTVKIRLAYHWDRNHKFLDGDQWIVYDGDRDTGGIWKRLEVSKSNEYIPRPVTNYIFDGYQTLKSYVLKNKPRSSVRPNTQTYQDKMAAKIANLILECNWERLNEEQNYEYAASCLITYGTVFKKDYWDTSSFGIVRVPKMVMTPVTDPNTGAVMGERPEPAIDPVTQQPLYDELPLGDVSTRVVEPYRMACDPYANDLHTMRWIMEYSIMPLDWVKQVYGKTGNGYTGKAEEVKEETQLSGSMRRFYHLKNSSGIKHAINALESATGTSGSVDLPNQAVVKEYYEAPSLKHPKGRMVVVANNVTLYAGESPYSGPEASDWHPYSECRWEIVPGRFWGKSPLDPATEIQKQINSIDSTIVLTRKTMAIPQKLIPLESGIGPGHWTGRPGQEIRPRTSGGIPLPMTVPGVGVDATVFQEREMRLEDLKNVMGSIDILKGDRPPGVTAASALNMLYEVGTGKLYPILGRWKKFVESSQKKSLRVISRYYQEPRPAFIAMLKSRNSELSDEALNQFIGKDLYDNCCVTVEAGSNIPKLQAAKQAALQEAAATGVLGLEMPSNRVEFLSQMGITGFDHDVGDDVRRAEWENDLLDNILHSPDNKPVVLQVDNHDIHIEILSRRMKQPSFLEVPQQIQQAYMAHLQEHENMKQMALQAQMMEAMAMGQAPMPPAPGNAPQKVTGHGKGPTTAQRDSMKTDMLPPGQTE